MSISLLGIPVYGPDLLMSGPASIDAVGPRHAARAAGIVNGVGSLGQLVSAYVVAVIVSRFGWDQLFTFFLICAAAAGSLLTLKWNKGLEENQSMTFACMKAVILDWAGTTVDFGSLAPVAALQRTFEAGGVPITAAEARAQMGVLKKDQIRFICQGGRVRAAWIDCHGQPASEHDVERLFSEFLPNQVEILAEYSAPIPGVCDCIESWKSAGLRIGSTTGYTRALLDVVMPVAARLGYSPDASVTPDEACGGRPKPFMCYRNAMLLEVFPLWRCVKIGDTPVDIAEGINAGMWTIGITATGNEVGLSQPEWEALPAAEQTAREQSAARRLMEAGATYTAPSLADCTELLADIERRIAAGEKP